MDSSVSLEDRIWFLRVCHHIPFALYLQQGTKAFFGYVDRFIRASSSVVRQMPGHNSQTRGTARALPILFYALFVSIVLFYVLFVCK